ncbi:MAG: hypothetical protein K1060chlam1_00685 [Candidatus Anoxychlamydiales bacterium]|nr:hypothetical protein [Candidatus Anoxychlamydiales bacterium]
MSVTIVGWEIADSKPVIIGRLVAGNDFDETMLATAFFSSLRKREIEKAAQIFKTLPLYLKQYCQYLKDSTGETYLSITAHK